ncbi:MAG: DUF1398 domain-containing protein [Flavobacterium sp.]|nr:MAG: DUF1398 domain-containing protein [Flavobacterium sp.]
MPTLQQIHTLHSKVKSGADFPAYIKDIKKIGVTSYETFVTDGRTDYFADNSDKITSPAKYEPVAVAPECDQPQFRFDLKEHQQGKSDFQTFIALSAKSGIEKWAVSMKKMTCTYYDKAGNEILVEEISG